MKTGTRIIIELNFKSYNVFFVFFKNALLGVVEIRGNYLNVP